MKKNWFICALNCSKWLTSATNRAIQQACGLLTIPTLLHIMLMQLCMLKLCVGKGRQVIKQLCSRVWIEGAEYYASATVATERAGYVLYIIVRHCLGGFYVI